MATKADIELEELFARKRMSKETFLRLARSLAPYRKMFLLNLLFTLGATASQLLGPKFIQIGIDRYLVRFSSTRLALDGILMVSALYLFNLLLGWWLSAGQVKSAIAVGQRAMNDLRLQVFEHIQRLSLNYFDRTHHGRILARADTDIDSLDRILTWGANQLLGSLLTLVGVIFLLLQYDWRLCLAVSVVLPPLVVATHLFHVRALDAYRRLRAQTSRLTASMAENIAGVRVVQAFSREEENLSRFQQLHATHDQYALAAARVFHTYLPFLGLLSGLGTAIILGYGGRMVLRHEITVGELAAFILYLGMFFGPIQTMGDLYNALMSTAASAERIFQLLDTQPQVQDRTDAQVLSAIRGHIAFENVWFRYDSTPADTWI
ncbi:MAG TPA: ABC transporter transmembrane domain-containing protein, partial [Candidatus Limnocylindrales bacterium]|nr:ABC transporter transmembrane domain-containing protein [Candidatus Limnocylindrales bacterium]